jgi:thioredoxin reductase
MHSMNDKNQFDVIVVGGSYSGLAAAMALGRALKKVLIVDYAQPCNRQTPYSHNFLTQDGKTPSEIAALAKYQVQLYNTVTFFHGLAKSGTKTKHGFEIQTASGEMFISKKLIFATGVRDIMPGIEGFDECWGISILHCPYCHGYEVRNVRTGILLNGEHNYDFVRLISNWTNDLKSLNIPKDIFKTLSSEMVQNLSSKPYMHPSRLNKVVKFQNHWDVH